MDDHVYVLNNGAIHHLDVNLLKWAFASLPFDLWQPLTWVSLAFDYHFWQLNPFGYHLTNILLHALNAAIVLLIADNIIRKIPALEERLCSVKFLYPMTLLLAGLLFGIHPLRVESVVWITERKDVLNGAFTFGALLFYLKHAELKSAGDERWITPSYLVSFSLFAFSLMAKPVSVVLPAMFLVVDWYPLGRWRKGEIWQLLIEKIPYFLISATISILTLYFASKNHILRPYDFLSPWQRLAVSGNAVFEYCSLLLFPVGITPLKLLPSPIPLVYTIKCSAVVLLLILSCGAARGRRWVPVTWACFLLPLIPVLAIFQNGDQAFAARYTYLPSLAPAIAAAALIGSSYVRMKRSTNRLKTRLTLAVISVYLMFFACMTYHLTRSWDDTESYWTRVLVVDPGAKPYVERGEYYSKVGRFSEAVGDYTRAIERADGAFRKYVYNIYAFRGEALRSSGRYEEAVRDFSTAIEMSPHRIYYFCRGRSLKALGRAKEAGEDFRIAGTAAGTVGYWYTDLSNSEIRIRLEKNPDDPDALAARAVAALRRRDYRVALADLDRALSLDSKRAVFYWDRSTVYFETGMSDRALDDCSAALHINPLYLEPYLRRAAIYAEGGYYSKAVDDLTTAIGIDKSSFEGYANRGLVLYRMGRPGDAIKDFDIALAINPESAETYYNRGLAHAASGAAGAADKDFRQARMLGYQ